MISERERFRTLVDRWMRSYCDGGDPPMSPDTFDWKNVFAIGDADVRWFLRGYEAGLFEASGRNLKWKDRNEKLTLFNSGPKKDETRWIRFRPEDCFVLASASRLVLEHGWPVAAVAPEKGGSIQMDLLVEDGETVHVACEAKSSRRLYEAMLDYLRACGPDISSIEGRDGNLDRKLRFLREPTPRLFWAVAGHDCQQVFRVVQRHKGVELVEVGPASLECPARRRSR